MDKEVLHTTLRSLRVKLHDAADIDAGSLELLIGLRDDIEELLELSSEAKKHHHIKVRRGLRVSIHRFEESHPRLTGVMSRLLDMLAGMGV